MSVWRMTEEELRSLAPGSNDPIKSGTIGVTDGLTTGALYPREWDTQHFEIPVAQLTLTVEDGISLAHPPIDVVKTLKDEAAARGLRLLFSRTRCDDWAFVHALETAGFLTMDQLVTFKALTVDAAPEWPGDLEIRQVKELSGELRSIVQDISSGAFVHSHFYSDKRLDQGKVDELYAKWATSTGPSTDTWIARLGDRVAGYVTCRRLDTTVDIQLIAVAAWARGRGVGSALVDTVRTSYWPACRHVLVGTQLANVPAVNLYLRTGLKISGIQTTFHKWIP